VAERPLSTEQFPELNPRGRALGTPSARPFRIRGTTKGLELCDLNRDFSQTNDPTS